MFVVISVWHGEGRDRTFLHGVFEEEHEAKEIMADVRRDHTYVEDEGYSLDEGMEHSVYISEIPLGIRVNEFIPTVI